MTLCRIDSMPIACRGNRLFFGSRDGVTANLYRRPASGSVPVTGSVVRGHTADDADSKGRQAQVQPT